MKPWPARNGWLSYNNVWEDKRGEAIYYSLTKGDGEEVLAERPPQLDGSEHDSGPTSGNQDEHTGTTGEQPNG